MHGSQPCHPGSTPGVRTSITIEKSWCHAVPTPIAEHFAFLRYAKSGSGPDVASVATAAIFSSAILAGKLVLALAVNCLEIVDVIFLVHQHDKFGYTWVLLTVKPIE